ncbi:MAG: hypothetical protein NTW54_08475 [Bacteroidetes bacterium]|nr:hypothetical protein [Bacteroidota bacterium]
MNKLLLLSLCLLMAQCSTSGSSSMNTLLSKEKTSVAFHTFFDTKNNREVTNLEALFEVNIPKQVTQNIKQENNAVKYDEVGEEKTIESLNKYLEKLKNYTRYIFEFTIDSIKCKVFTTENIDVIHLLMMDKKSTTYRYSNESFFVAGTILKTIDKEMEAQDGDFTNAFNQKTTTYLFDENKLFYHSEQKNSAPQKSIKLNDQEAYSKKIDLFLFRQLCTDAILALKDKHPELFQE